MTRTIGITGGTGFIGRHLAAELVKHDFQVVIFTRSPEKRKRKPKFTYAYWNPAANKIDVGALKQVDTMVHLAGAGIADKRWTKKRKKEIVDSRVKATDFLVSQLRQYAPECRTLIAASAMGYYGADKHKRPFTESDPPNSDFLAQTCVKWEKASMSANDFLRTVIFRFGHVLGKDGGAFPKFLQPIKFGLVPIIGSGRQVLSWIHIDDHIHMLYSAITDEQYKGVYNAASPHAVTYKKLMKTIAQKKGGLKFTAHIPTALLKLSLGEVSKELYKSTTVSAQKLLDTGFQFQYPAIEQAVGNLLTTK
ncbi:MAG: hypothetical protein K0R82_1569 [Flavipsychrobacter sp.]|jgi:uncharacterized protein (TIGR01777 family)|nr:hypothetical protein [Flavipsychrobacter sp.]